MLEIAQELKQAGFRVFMSSSDLFQDYLFAAWEGNIGYVQQNKLSGMFEFSTVHRPYTTTGTGYRLGESDSVTVESMKNACLAIAPSWAMNGDLSSIKKWTFESWLKSHSYLKEV